MVTKLKPYNPSASEFVASWHVIDAKDKVLGRLGTEIAVKLMGKDRPGYVPHLLSGDFVVVINADKIRLTGNKSKQKVYLRHSQKPGNLKEIPYETVLEKFPERIIERTVRGMLPKNRLGVQMLSRLKVYAGEEHPHAAQLTGSERRLAAIAAGEPQPPVKKSVRRRKPRVAKPVAAAPAKAAPATEAPAEEAAPAAAVVEEAPKAAAPKPAAKKAPATRTRKTAAAKTAESKSSDSKSTKSSTTTKKAPAKKAAAKTGTPKSAASKPSTTRKTSTSKSTSKSSASTAAKKSTTRPSRSTTTRKSG